MRDHMHIFGAVSAILPAVANADPAPIAIDRSGFDALTFVLQVGVGGISFTNTNRIDFFMEDSDDGTNWVSVMGDNVLPSGSITSPLSADPGVVLSLKGAHPSPSTHRFGYVDGYVGAKRYVRLRARFVGTHGTGTPLSAIAILGEARELPVAA